MEKLLYKEYKKKEPRTRRPEILRAALELFAENGVKATTIKDIASKAMVSEGAIYRHWKSKDELVKELFFENMKRFKTHLEGEIEGLKDTKQRLKKAIETFYTFAAEEPMVYKFLIHTSHYELSYLLPHTPKPLDIFMKIVKEGIYSGELKKVDPQLAGAFIIGAVTKLTDFRRMGIINKEPKSYLDPLIDLLWKGIKARDGARKQL